MIRGVETKAGTSALRQLREIVSRHLEGSRGPRFVDRDIYAAEPGSIHAHVCHEATAGVNHGNVVRNFQFARLALARVNDASCVLQCQRDHLSRHFQLLTYESLYSSIVSTRALMGTRLAPAVDKTMVSEP